MRKTLTLMLLSLTVQTNGQRLQMPIPVDNNGDTSFWFRNTIELCEHLGLTYISKSSHEFHLRLWGTDNRIVDVWEDSNNTPHASLAFWAVKCRNGRIRRKLYYQHHDLDSLTAANLVKTIYRSNIMVIPTEDSIEGWDKTKVLGGFLYNIEIKKNNQYSFKQYDNPINQIAVPEADGLRNFIENFEKQLEIKTQWDSFYKSIPFKCSLIAGYIPADSNILQQNFKVLRTGRTANKTNKKTDRGVEVP